MKALLDIIEKQPQSEPVIGRADMVENNAGGYVFEVSPWEYFDRFLLLGSEGGTFYCDERKHTKENVTATMNLVKFHGQKVMRRIVEVSDQGLAPKNDYCIFVLAMVFAYGDEDAKRMAELNFNKVIRIGTHLFQFMEYVKGMRGFGKQMRRTINKWYLTQTPANLAYQVTKYRNRHGFTHRDVLRICHPKINRTGLESDQKLWNDLYIQDILQWIVQPKKYHAAGKNNSYIEHFEHTQNLSSDSQAAQYLEKHKFITHEMIPSEIRGKKTWTQLLQNGMGMTALLRNLATLTRLEVLRPMTDEVNLVVNQLKDEEAIKKQRLHPINVLISMMTYDSGEGVRGNNTWDPIAAISDALEDTMMLSFKELTQIDKKVYIGIDCSGSMGSGGLMGIPRFNPLIASAALAVCLAKQCTETEIKGFAAGAGGRWRNSQMNDLHITARTTIENAIIKCGNLDWGGTDCALPMLDALKRKIPVDCFIVLTDNETWAGEVHPTEALKRYRKEMNRPDTRLIVVGMTATEFSIADPQDPKQYDVVGFNANLPKMIENCL